jgi:RNA polymerase sigma factor (sigma-70 family)
MDKTIEKRADLSNENETVQTTELSLFFKLYSVHEKAFYNYIVSQIKADEANDVLHDAILTGLNSFHQLNNRGDFTKWFFGVVKNTIKVYWRNKVTNQHAVQQYRKIIIDLERKLTIVDNPEQNTIKTEQVRIAYTVLDELSESIRIAFRLHYEEELSFHEIGEILNVHENTIKNWIKRAKKHLSVNVK